MSDTDGLQKLPPDILDLLEGEQASAGPAASVKDRVLERVSSTVGIDPGAGPGNEGGTPSSSAPSSPAPSGAELAGGALSAKSIALAAFVSGAVFGGGAVKILTQPQVIEKTVYVERQKREEREAPKPQPPPKAPPEAPPVPVAPPPPQKTPKRKLEPRQDLRKERDLLDRARTALGRGKAKDAHDALTLHEKRFPKGALREERDALLILALVELGNKPAAQKRAARFKKRYPGSLFGPMIEARLSQ